MKNRRMYGSAPFKVALLHGGPGAAGEMAPLAKELFTTIGVGVLEPLQTTRTIDGQVQELKNVLKKKGDLPIILIGWSWGAWLGFIFTAKYPSLVKKLIIIGSGSFEEKYAKDIMRTRLSRLGQQDKKEVVSLMEDLEDRDIQDKNKLLAQFGKLISKADSFSPLPDKSEILEYRFDIYNSIFKQAKDLRNSGKLLEFGKNIQCPVVALHGDYDPHVAKGVKEPLTRLLSDFRFIILKNCGHKPWIEKIAKDRFFEILKDEIE